jgi:hypothetical protein
MVGYIGVGPMIKLLQFPLQNIALTPDQLTSKYWQEKGYKPIKVEKWVLYPQPRRSDFLKIYSTIYV